MQAGFCSVIMDLHRIAASGFCDNGDRCTCSYTRSRCARCMPTVCVCVCVCARARARACVFIYKYITVCYE